jgi:hypothetical protein
MKRFFILALFLQASLFSFGQKKVRPVIWFGPANNVSVCGINISPLVYKLPTRSTINGLNIEGVGLPVFSFMIPHDPVDQQINMNIGDDFNVNGLTVGPLGLLHKGTVNGLAATTWFSVIDQVNGMNIALIGSVVLKQRGVSVTGYFNSAYDMEGVQISVINTAKSVHGLQLGLINRTTFLNGLQIGLWNINEKRKLPVINW